MTKQELVNAVAKRAEVNQIDVEHVVENILEVVKETIASGESIFLRGFGTMKRVERKEKVARNITKGTSMIVPAHFVPHFKPSDSFRKLVNK